LELIDKIKTLNNLVDNLVESVQKITSKLRPGILDELGLIAAIEWQTEEFKKLTGINCSVVLPTTEPELDNQRSTAIFRILQEALTNIARHSNANKVNVSLLFNLSNIILEIKDNGKGITNEQIKDFRSLGIHGMEERVMAFGGQFYIEGLAGNGTTVKIEIPIEKQNE
jgi:signal transduction histidine kinase